MTGPSPDTGAPQRLEGPDAPLPVLETLRDAFVFTARNWKALIAVALVPMVLQIALAKIHRLVAGFALRSTYVPDQPLPPIYHWLSFGLATTIFVAMLYVGSVLSVAWFRYALPNRRDGRRAVQFRVGFREFWFFLVALALTGPFILLSAFLTGGHTELPTSSALNVVYSAVSHMGTTWVMDLLRPDPVTSEYVADYLVRRLAQFPLLIAMTLLWVRVLYALPAAAMGHSGSLRLAWRRSRRETMRLLTVALLPVVVYLVLSFLRLTWWMTFQMIWQVGPAIDSALRAQFGFAYWLNLEWFAGELFDWVLFVARYFFAAVAMAAIAFAWRRQIERETAERAAG